MCGPQVPDSIIRISREVFPLCLYLLVCLLHMHVCCVLSCFSHVQLYATPWTVAGQAPLSMGFSRQECWSGLPCTPPGDLPDPGIEPMSLRAPALAGRFFTTSTIREALHMHGLKEKASR